MKKLFAILALMGAMTFAPVSVMAQDAPAEGGIHKELKTKYIEGGADFMSLPAIALVLGLAFCIERIVYLSLAEINAKKFICFGGAVRFVMRLRWDKILPPSREI